MSLMASTSRKRVRRDLWQNDDYYYASTWRNFPAGRAGVIRDRETQRRYKQLKSTLEDMVSKTASLKIKLEGGRGSYTETRRYGKWSRRRWGRRINDDIRPSIPHRQPLRRCRNLLMYFPFLDPTRVNAYVLYVVLSFSDVWNLATRDGHLPTRACSEQRHSPSLSAAFYSYTPVQISVTKLRILVIISYNVAYRALQTGPLPVDLHYSITSVQTYTELLPPCAQLVVFRGCFRPGHYPPISDSPLLMLYYAVVRGRKGRMSLWKQKCHQRKMNASRKQGQKATQLRGRKYQSTWPRRKSRYHRSWILNQVTWTFWPRSINVGKAFVADQRRPIRYDYHLFWWKFLRERYVAKMY